MTIDRPPPDEDDVAAPEDDEIRLVPLRADTVDSTLVTPIAGGEPFDLEVSSSLPEATVTALLDSTLRLAAPHEFSREVAQALATLPTHVVIADVPGLVDHGVLVLPPNGALVAGARLHYETGLGLWVDEETDE